MLWKSPGFTLVAAIALALGIGANTAIFSVVNGVLLQPLPYQDPASLVRLGEWSKQVPGMSIAYPNFLDWRERNHVFSGIAATQFNSFNLSGTDQPERLLGRAVSANFFDVLGVRPALGRSFVAEEDRPGASRVCIVSNGAWQRLFGSDPQLNGRTLLLNGDPYTVVGILPASYRYGAPTDIFVPIGLKADSEMMASRDNHPGIYAVARLKNGVTLQQADAEMKAIANALSAEYPKTNSGSSVTIVSLTEYFVGDIRPMLLILLGAVGLVLLIACANVANLLLARSSSRSKEIAIRTALGAGRWRVVRQLLTESVLLALLGGGAGLLLALWGIDLIRSASIDSIPTTAEIKLDSTVLFFTLAIAVLTGAIFGLVPAIQASRSDLNDALKEGGRSGTAAAAKQRARGLLVIFEVALSLVLLVGAGLLVRSFARLRQTELGFEPANLVTMKLSRTAGADEGPQVLNFLHRVEEKIQTIPGVMSVSYSDGLPLLGATEGGFSIEGRPKSERFLAVRYHTSPSYQRTLGLRLLKGRYLTERDTLNSPRAVVIDEEFAREQFPGEEPVGRYLAGDEESGIPHAEIVGVISHVKHYGLDTPGPVQPQAYYAIDQIPIKYVPLVATNVTMIVRAPGDPSGIVGAVREAIKEEDKNQPLYDIKTMNQVVSESIASQQLSMTLFSLFAMVALVLAIVGIYGVMSYTVSQRTHEIGIRMALGAQIMDVLKLVVSQGMRLVLIGVGVGIFGAFLITRVMSSLLFGVSATDPLTFVGVSLLMGGTAFLACFIPARRAAKVEPTVALRHE
jgi:putative ABC transport system permease protein